MRRLEYIGGGSQKFWEGVRDNTDVVLSWGRLGTAGQSKRKGFASVEAAEEFLAKQAGDKVKKGYVEAGTARAATTAEPAEVASAAQAADVTQAAEATEVAQAVEVAQAAEAIEVAQAVEAINVAPVAADSMPDEDAFTPPSGVVRMAYARRDQGRSRYRPDPEAAGAVARLVVRHRQPLDIVFGREDSDRRIVEAARRYLDGAPDAVGAAAVLTTVSRHGYYSDQDEVGKFGQAWLTTHGLLFAVEAVMALAAVTLNQRGNPRQHSDIRFAEGDEELPWRWAPSNALADVRAAVASASDDEYAQVVERLAALRGNANSRLLAAFLAPTETAWVDELGDPGTHSHRGMWMYLAIAYRAEQLDEVHSADYELRYHGRVLPTIVRTVGPPAARALARWTKGVETDVLRRLLAAIVAMPTDEAFTELLTRVEQPHFRPAVQEAMQRYPVRAARLLSAAAAEGNAVAVELLRGHLLARPALLADVVPTLPPAAREAAEATQAGLVRLPDAPPESLPTVLTSPPWTRSSRTSKPVVLTGLVLDAPTRVVWAPGEHEKALAARARLAYRGHGRSNVDWQAEIADTRSHHWAYPSLLLHAPMELAEPLLADWQSGNSYGVLDWGAALLARFDVAAVPAVTATVASATGQDDLKVLMPVLDTTAAAVLASALVRRKTARPVVRAWLLRHGLAALPYLLPAALDRAGKPRQAAETALRVLAAHEGVDAVVAEAARLAGEEAGAGVAQVLAADPLELLPKKLPVPGVWADPAALPQIRLRDSELALSPAATADLLTMFALGEPGEPYGGVAQVAEVCDPTSLARFGWAVFEQWRKAGMPPKDGWALYSLGAIGDDDTVRELAPVIRNWPGEGGHARAVTGLDVLAEIGSDVALMHLNGIAQKVKFGGLKQRAGEKIDLVAANLGLTAEQLADRLVPDLGLQADGTLVLDYGPRRFVVGFDEALRPYVSDEDGTRRKALPKPGAKDDEELAPHAYQRFTGLKKDVRTLAAAQITRLERAMVTGRRWSPEDFAAYFAGHPLLWHVVRRLVWGVYRDGDLVGAFRLAEDRTLADAEDEGYAVPAGATVGVAHPLHLGGALAAWAEVFADYEILQPFPQLGRPVLALTGEERAAPHLERFARVKVNVGRVLGLGKHGWERTTPQDGGVEPGVVKPLPGGWFAVLELEEGIVAGSPTMLGEDQLIRRVFLSTDRDGWWGAENTPLDRLDPVSASELLADLSELVAAK
ncbi:DUF4132 domain-containing protein [Actinokineospora sp. 24-640]